MDPSTTQKILFTLTKTCDAHDQATWKMTFELQEGNPLATVVKLDVEIDPVNNPQAEATAANGLDDNQQGQAQIAAAVSKDNTVSDADKKAAVQQVVASRDMTTPLTLNDEDRVPPSAHPV